MDYYINAGIWSSIFAVPSDIVDKYIKLASGAAVKVLLFTMRNNNQHFTKEELSKNIGISEENVEEAFCFWEQVGIFSKVKSEIIDNPSVNEMNETKTAPLQNKEISETKIVKPKKHTENSSKSLNLTPSEIAERLELSKDLNALFSMAQNSFGEMINYTQQKSLFWMHEYLGLNVDVILMLIEYCVSINKKNIRYIETIAIAWQEKDINTLKDAEVEIQRMEESKSYTKRVLRALGVNTKPSPNMLEYIETWHNAGCSVELIEEAYNRTVDKIGKFSIGYINTIVTSWAAKSITTLEQANEEKWDGNDENKSQNQQSYDINTFDSLAVNLVGNSAKGE